MAGAVLGCALLAGCSPVGDIWVGEEDVRFDVTVTQPKYAVAGDACDQLRNYLRPVGGRTTSTVVDLPAPADHIACRVTGTWQMGDRSSGFSYQLNHAVNRTNDAVVVTMPPRIFWSPDDLVDVDLRLHMPGRLVSTSDPEATQGNVIHLRDSEQLNRRGFSAASNLSGAPDPFVLGIVIGGAGGVLAGALGAWLVGRRRTSAPDADDERRSAVPPPAAPDGARTTEPKAPKDAPSAPSAPVDDWSSE